jgi:hypothetical protein
VTGGAVFRDKGRQLWVRCRIGNRGATSTPQDSATVRAQLRLVVDQLEAAEIIAVSVAAARGESIVVTIADLVQYQRAQIIFGGKVGPRKASWRGIRVRILRGPRWGAGCHRAD